MSDQHRIVSAVAAIALLTFLAGCALSADPATLDRQAKVHAPWWFGSPVSEGVYSPAVREEVYSSHTKRP